MSAEQFVTYCTWAIFVLLFVFALIEAVRCPLRVNIDVALLFAAPTLIILIGVAAMFGLVQPGPLPNAVNTTLLLAIAYWTLRLVRNFAPVPVWLHRASAAGFVVLSAGAFAFWPPRPALLNLAQIAYFIGLELYAGVAFALAAWGAVGITRRRLRTVALGSFLLGLALLFSALRGRWEGFISLFEVSALASGLSYFLGVIPPSGLRRSWQEPELRAFLKATAALSRESGEAALREIERRAAASAGAPIARLGLWDEASRALRFSVDGQQVSVPLSPEDAAARAFRDQRPVLAVAPTIAGALGASHPGQWAALAAPVTSGDRRYGVLTVYAPTRALFASSDLDVVELLAAQSAAVLESRGLVSELAQAEASVEAARLKDDFLSAAAHELKTPLTTLLAQAQLLERRLRRSPEAPANPKSVGLILQEAARLRDLVDELLDAADVDRPTPGQALRPVDLLDLARQQAARRASMRHPFEVDAGGPATCLGDATRLDKLIGHLLDNAVKFSPDGGEVRITLRRTGRAIQLSVEDCGIGIPADDLRRVFERYARGRNVDDRSFAGLGLGLYICRAIVEQHGGRIWAESDLGKGSVFYVEVPEAYHED